MKPLEYVGSHDEIARMQQDAISTGWLCLVRPTPVAESLRIILLCELTSTGRAR